MSSLMLEGLSSSCSHQLLICISPAGFTSGLVAGIFTMTHCGIQRYRGRNDWVSCIIEFLICLGFRIYAFA